QKATATAYNNLAILNEEIGEYKKALTNYLKALDINKKLYGEEHPITQNSYKNIALLYYTMGNYKEASRYAKLAKHKSEEIELEPIIVNGKK
ncbi:MAG TPA: tetratricopeptide repeat protein, partial [Campylobacterales bacterium]|nr:tetratricopeptide repeat protein [Campylobacterales bacterium]